MDRGFWQERWADNQIGFHQKSVNRLLAKYWNTMQIPQGAHVLVPLCGKSLDMLWLGKAGYSVTGTELSDIAVQSFFLENRLRFNAATAPPFKTYESRPIRLLAGDHFELTEDHLPRIDAVYDRAALVALPEPLRSQYVSHLRNLVPSGCVILLISLEYDPDLVSPPPFDIYQEQIEKLYSPWCEVEHLTTISADIKGTDGFESAYRITVK